MEVKQVEPWILRFSAHVTAGVGSESGIASERKIPEIYQ